MEVNFRFTEEEVDTTGDGEADTVGAFNKRERFLAYVPGLYSLGLKVLLFDQTWDYGYHRRSDGTCEVYHRGESFHGPFMVLPIVWLHQGVYGIWATEKYINGPEFGSEEDGAWEKAEEKLKNIPKHVFHEFIGRLKASKKASLEKRKENQLETKEGEKTLRELEVLQAKIQSGAVRNVYVVSKGKRSVTVQLEDQKDHETMHSLLGQLTRTNKGTRELLAAMEDMVQKADGGVQPSSEKKAK